MGNGDQKMQRVRKEKSIVKVPHIDFVFKDQQWKFEDWDFIIQIL